MRISCLPCLAPLVGLLLQAGCTSTTGTSTAALQTQNRMMAEQNRAQAARIENLEIHSRNIEDQLKRAEEDLAMTDQQLELNEKQLANFQDQHNLVRNQSAGLAARQVPMPPELSRRLVDISRRYPSLQFDPNSGVSKLDTDILFDTGSAELKPGAEELLREVAHVLASSEAKDLRLMVAGHTDDRQVARKPARDKYGNNFQLSTDRALVVADSLRKFGVDEQRMAVAGFGPHQPIAPNLTPEDRQKNRRVELFVLAPDVPVIGWTVTTPTLY
jgi:chemotaxis protein MotB